MEPDADGGSSSSGDEEEQTARKPRSSMFGGAKQKLLEARAASARARKLELQAMGVFGEEVTFI